jgi:hypothetical protein
MRLFTAAFALLLLYMHRDGQFLDQPLSMFRDGDQRYFGEFAFLLLGMIGSLLLRQLLIAKSYRAVTLLSMSFGLLLIVAVTPSISLLHDVCAFSLLGLVGGYYTVWLHLEKSSWRWPHLFLVLCIVLGAWFGAFGFWQKVFILYTVLLINVQYSRMTQISWQQCFDFSGIESWGDLRIWSALFVLTLWYAHDDPKSLDLPLSVFRDGEQRYLGAILFVLLGVIGAIQIRKLLSLRGYVGAFTLSLAFGLLLIVMFTPSYDLFHNLCALWLLGLVGVYYTMWLNLEKPIWLWPHLLVTAAIVCGAVCGAYGFWQKGFILYTLLLINVQYSFLKTISPAVGVQYTLHPVSNRRLPPRQTVYRLDREFFDR